jgi:hypothetical protein
MTIKLGATWLHPEDYASPSGSINAGRKAHVVLRANPHNPIRLPYGELRTVAVGIPDTMSTIPARLRFAGRRLAGYVSVDDGALTFTPEADPTHCIMCKANDGCKR